MYVHEMTTPHPGGFASANAMEVILFRQTLTPYPPNAGILDKSVLIKKSDFVGPQTADLEFSASGVSGITIPEFANQDTTAFRFSTFEIPHPQYNVTLKVSDIRFLDIDGNDLEMETIAI